MLPLDGDLGLKRNFKVSNDNEDLSLFPKLDAYLLETLTSKFGKIGFVFKILKTMFDKITNTILYNTNCKFCYNVGREHKRNHVWFLANLTNYTIEQGCYDADCRGYRRILCRFPVELLINGESRT